MSSITLTASMRSNLSSLKSIATQMDRTQDILSTGKKVNSAIDNATNFYQARALTNRAADLNALLDSMGQGIQTIQAATEGLEAATAFLEQATAVANQALTEDIGKTYQDYLDEGYKEITSAMGKAEIEALLVEGGKVILKDNITLAEGLEITAKDVTIFGNGKTLTVNADDTAAITVKGKENSVNISGLNIVANGTNAIGIKATESGTITIDNLDKVTATGTGATQYYRRNEELFNGKEYTQAIYDQLSAAGTVTGTATDYVMNYKADGVADDDADFGKGQWYIGAIGEWTDLYGYDYADVTTDYGSEGQNGKTLAKINETLTSMGNDASILSLYYYSSSEYSGDVSWTFGTGSGYRGNVYKNEIIFVRSFNVVENCYNPNTQEGPQIGDIMYADKTWSSADEYVANKAVGKVAVGVVFDTDTINGDVKIVALKNAHTSTVQMDPTYTDITNVPNYDTSTASLKNTGEIVVTYEKEAKSNVESLSNQFENILGEFDKLIADSSYQGVNLLKGADLTVTFNESRNNRFTVKGKDMSANNIGLLTNKWKTKADIEKSINELTSAINAIRDFSTELGNSYSIIQTRQDFTEALTDVLETGTDDLVLADMNEASAQYLMLQTRQQLAVNSLSLASQSAQSILRLF